MLRIKLKIILKKKEWKFGFYIYFWKKNRKLKIKMQFKKIMSRQMSGQQSRPTRTRQVAEVLTREATRGGVTWAIRMHAIERLRFVSAHTDGPDWNRAQMAKIKPWWTVQIHSLFNCDRMVQIKSDWRPRLKADGYK